MYCPNCRAEYQPHVKACGHCHIPLVAELPEAGAEDSALARLLEGQELEPLVIGNFLPLREVQQDLMKTGIPCMISDDRETEDEAGVHTRYYLMVPVNSLPAARQHLEKRWQDGVAREGLVMSGVAESSSPGQVGTCPACQTAVPETASECPECGLFLGEASA